MKVKWMIYGTREAMMAIGIVFYMGKSITGMNTLQ